MPYDPNYPQDGQLIDAGDFRSQFQGLKALIDSAVGLTGVAVDAVTSLDPGEPATVNLSIIGSTLHFTFGIPRGSDGAIGPQGPPLAGVLVDNVTTLNPGDPASVQAFFDGSNVHLTFGLPRGNDGSQGMQGIQGQQGADGGIGPQGPPFATALIDGVTTLNPGEAATVQTSFDGTNVRFLFGLPRGADGSPGEVTNAQLDAAITGTSGNTNAVSTLDSPFTNDPPTLTDLEVMRAKVNELILAARR